MNDRRFQDGAEWFLRLALGLGFLSAVADRFGIWGAPGEPGVVWGDWQHFEAYVGQLNFWAPEAIRPALASAATIAEVGLGIALFIPYRTTWVALLAGLLLVTFAVSMTIAFGVKAPIDYGVWTAAGGAFLLASVTRK